MTSKSWKSIVTVLIVTFTLNGTYAQEPRPAKKAKGGSDSSKFIARKISADSY